MAQQFYVDLGVEPTIEKKSGYALWALSAKDLEYILAREELGTPCAKWELRKETSRTVKKGTYHPTARARKDVPAPVRDFLKTDDASPRRVLYYGCGKDEPGAAAMARNGASVTEYDPYHEDPGKRFLLPPPKWQEDKYDEVFCIYTLNVVDRETGIRILGDIRAQLKYKTGRAIIAVRRDL